MPLLDLDAALAQVRTHLLAPHDLVRAVAAGRRRAAAPAVDADAPERVTVRVVDLKRGPVLQVTSMRGPVVRTVNHDLAAGEPLAAAVDDLLAVPFATWHVETTRATVMLRVTKKGQGQVTTAGPVRTGDALGERVGSPADDRANDRTKQHLLDPGDPLFAALGADAAKRRQVEAFGRQLAAAVSDAAGALPADRPLRVVDLGCGNAYLTFAAHRFLAERPAGACTLGVELRADLVQRARDRARSAGLDGLDFVAGTIADADPEASLGGRPDVVLALHACDTATDDALARAVRWGSPVVLAAPCCHRDVQRQLWDARRAGVLATGQAALVRSPILRERFADVLTDALRADILRSRGYAVDVVEFVDSAHTPRNALLRARAAALPPSETAAAAREVAELTAAWGVRPALAERLA